MLLKGLTEARGVSGCEHEVRDLIRAYVGPYVDSLATDTLGNLIAHNAPRQAQDDAPRVLLTAHMDEVGLMVTQIDKNGLLKVKPVGGVDERVLVSKPVVVGRNRVPGVIGAKPIHLQEPEERKKPFKLRELFVDIGTSDAAAAESLVRLGDAVAFVTEYEEFPGGHAKGKAFDDRVGCAVLAEVLRGRYGFHLYGAFTVQEEVGLRGAGVAAYGINPDLALVLEGTTASDVPGSEEHEESTTVGSGPALTLMDMRAITSRPITERLLDLARRHDLPVQFRRLTTGGTEAGRIQLTREGVPVAVLAVPCRYIHSPVGLISLRDFDVATELTRLFLASLDEEGIPR